uniref:Transcription factor Spi-C n=1 Tax=Pygocentrus nattereri TaxID=42514 RepID=A0A3B4CKB1_PYGNA
HFSRLSICVFNQQLIPMSAHKLSVQVIPLPKKVTTFPPTHTMLVYKSVSMIAGKRLRLFHFLFEMLEDPGMAHCVSWVPSSAGVFRFSSTHKERVAELWGQRKGNRRPMTYQKMSRALRNYIHSGEIIKVRKKLTYQFSGATLTTLRNQQGKKNALH